MVFYTFVILCVIAVFATICAGLAFFCKPTSQLEEDFTVLGESIKSRGWDIGYSDNTTRIFTRSGMRGVSLTLDEPRETIFVRTLPQYKNEIKTMLADFYPSYLADPSWIKVELVSSLV